MQTLIYQNDFEGSSDQGWTHQELAVGLQDDWQRDYSYGASGVAFGNSWFEPDTSVPGAENKVWGTDLGEPGLWNGQYNVTTDSALLSPEILIPAGTTVQVSYKRWLTKGFSSEAKVTVKDSNSGTLIVELMNPAPHQIMDREWKSVQTSFTTPAWSGGFQLEFSLVGGFDTAGGWTIDDIELYVLGAAPVPCGTSGELTNTLHLSGNTAVSLGDSPSLTVTNAPANSQVRLYYSSSIVSGSQVQGHCFDLDDPATLVSSSPVTADANGTATIPLGTITAGVGQTLYFEAVVLSPTMMDSNVLPLTIWN